MKSASILACSESVFINDTSMFSCSTTLVLQSSTDSFGNLLSEQNPEQINNPWKFQTEYLDSETGEYYWKRRYYSPEEGRWLNRDPIEEFGGVNLYLTCGNNTINCFDALGLVWNEKDGGEDYYVMFQIGVVSPPGKPVQWNTHQFTGGTMPMTTEVIPPVLVQVGEDCYCVKEGTGKATVNVTVIGVKAGRPSISDLTPEEYEKFSKLVDQGWTWSETLPGISVTDEVAKYGTWHEKTEASLYHSLHDNTIAIAEARAKEYQCYPNYVRTIKKKTLEDYIRWDKAMTTFSDNRKKIRDRFDPDYGIRLNGNQTGLIGGKPKESFVRASYSDLYSPDIWK